ncbi:D-ribose pyranase [Endozoicomonas ascidiicola]|uniref:D-ribose pyranase n=1 Tax=Endozoicomonas ascidiicola TaxID=1698521 RepID=UPI00082E4CD1|nr:D-ribose pyranase [Endozoicomonas ascidiicola]USN26974.1 D-ribose pyranase [synthetic construct]
MKKSKLINTQLSLAVASLGHGQALTICDCGLPIGSEVQRIDLALTHGVPGFMETLDVVLSEQQVEEVVVAEELAVISPALFEKLTTRIAQLEDKQGREVNLVMVSHESFKTLSDQSLAVVRTGECTPYANIILRSGVVF